MRARFGPAPRRLRGELAVPADKSISHRAALLAAMCARPVRVRNYLDSADTAATLDALRALGALVETRPDELVVRGTGLRHPEQPSGTIDVRNSGTLMRLLPGWLASVPGGVWRLDGDDSIRRRPMDRIAVPLALMGARVLARDGRFAPLEIHGARLHGIEYELPVASAQVKSCLLLAGLTADAPVTVVEPAPSRDHTERMLRGAGVTVTRDGARVTVCAADELEVEELAVPGDMSSAAFHVAAALIVPRSRVRLTGVGVNWTRSGFVRILRRMGAAIEGDLEPPGVAGALREPVSDLEVAAGPLRGTVVEAEEVPPAIDELPLVALVACFAEGRTAVRGAGELRVKESDRIAGVVGGLRALGASIEATPDGFEVEGTGGLEGGALDAAGDHRMAMLGAIAGLGSRAGVEVAGMHAAAVSYPAFADHLARLAGVARW